MDWKKRLEDGMKTGVKTSRKVLGKAKSRAKDIGDYSVLSLEVRQLQSKHDDLVAKLGALTFHLLQHEQRGSISAKTADVKELLAEIEEVSEHLARKRQALNERDEGSGAESTSTT